jgi:hypothetical protein
MKREVFGSLVFVGFIYFINKALIYFYKEYNDNEEIKIEIECEKLYNEIEIQLENVDEIQNDHEEIKDENEDDIEAEIDVVGKGNDNEDNITEEIRSFESKSFTVIT